MSLLSALSGEMYSRCTPLASGAFKSVYDERVELPQKRGESLSGTSWRQNERVAATCDHRPPLHLGRRWRTQSLDEPLANDRMEVRERIHNRFYRTRHNFSAPHSSTRS